MATVDKANDFSAQDDGNFYVTSTVKSYFDEHGFVLIRGLLAPAEVERLKNYMESNTKLNEKSYGRLDGQGLESRLALWNVAGDDLSGVISR